MRSALLTLLVGLLLLPSGCFRPRERDPQAEPPRIEVRNRYFGAIVVYVLSGGNDVRLGMIQSNRSETFDFPLGINPYSSTIRLRVDPIGDYQGYISPGIAASSGTTIVLTVENELRHSNVIVR